MNKQFKEKIEENKKNMGFYNQDGSQPKRKPFKKKFVSKKIKPITYVIKNTDEAEDTFNEVLGIMTSSCETVSTYCVNAFGEITENPYNEEFDFPEDINSDDWFYILSQYFTTHYAPKLIGKRNIHNALSVTSNKLYIRAGAKLGFGFELTYEVVDGQAYIKDCTGSITLFVENGDLVKSLEDNGFVQK